MRSFLILFAFLICGALSPDNSFALTVPAESSLNPDTAGVDVAPPVKNTGKKVDVSLRKACRMQRIISGPYDIETCKKRCLNGEKKFCLCARNPCSHLDQMDEQEEKKADDGPAIPAPPITPPADTTNLASMGCPLQGNFIPAVGAAAEMPWSTLMKQCVDGGKLKTRDGAPAGSAGAQLWTCKALCDRGCRKFCDYCALGYGEPLRARGQITMQAQAYCGKGKKPGVGFPGVPEAYAYGNSGIPQRQWQGMFAELEFVNWVALRNAFNAGVLGKADEWTGEPTIAEVTWLAIHQPRRSDFYRKWWWEQLEGGSQSNPVSAKGEQGRKTYSAYGTLQPGLHSYTAPPWNWPFWINYQP